ncbi:MAG: sigma-70 region 4 domain-containing protein, partial [Candidatus Omnitrophica bacterium]|nr:sigma-70 region 4 domain-containing protein [Candidatus Omnitrophota bacterium]
VFTLKHFDGLRFDQIAEIMKISPSTAKTHFYRSIMNFKKSLRDYVEK